MKLQLSAIVEKGDKFFITSCPEVPEANGQGSTREEALKDLAASFESVLEYRREEALAQASPNAEKTA